MAILFIPGKFESPFWIKELKKIDPGLDIRTLPDVGNPADIDFALVWYYPKGELLKYPNLKCISSMGAGVDNILSDPQLPSGVHIVRVVDPLLVRDMSQYIIWAVLNFTRNIDKYRDQQIKKIWQPHQPNNELSIGIMGLGQLGHDATHKLIQLGFHINGWSRHKKEITGAHCFCGESEFKQFLEQTHILVNLLPLTPSTRGILNQKTFFMLPKGAYIINVGRGGHLVDDDLISAITQGHIAGACLDVFHQEPLPSDHPFWTQPNIIVTPHVASVTNAKSVAAQVVENYHRLLAGKPLLNEVNLQQGY